MYRTSLGIYEAENYCNEIFKNFIKPVIKGENLSNFCWVVNFQTFSLIPNKGSLNALSLAKLLSTLIK